MPLHSVAGYGDPDQMSSFICKAQFAAIFNLIYNIYAEYYILCTKMYPSSFCGAAQDMVCDKWLMMLVWPTGGRGGGGRRQVCVAASSAARLHR